MIPRGVKAIDSAVESWLVQLKGAFTVNDYQQSSVIRPGTFVVGTTALNTCKALREFNYANAPNAMKLTAKIKTQGAKKL